MRYFILSFLVFIVGLFIGYFGTSLFERKRTTQTEVLSQATSINQEFQSPTPTLTPTSTLEPTFTPTPTRVPSPTPKPQPAIKPEEIHGYIQRFAGQYGVDPNILRHIAVCESGFNPLAVNGPYAGLYQFNKTTWKTNRLAIGESIDPDLRFNAEEAIQTAAYVVSKGQRHLWPNCFP